MILTFNNKILSAGSKWLEQGSSPTPGPGFRTVIIGNQEWMAENLTIDDGLGGIWIEDKGEVYGYNYGTQYFYDRHAAYRIAQAFGDGWRLPSVNDFNTLQSTLQSIIGSASTASSVKTTTGWSSNGTDVFGLSIYASGYPDSAGSTGAYVDFWTSDVDADKYYYFRLMSSYSNFRQSSKYGGQFACVRLVRDVV